jgi:nucleoside-diphosphate-sugar epimerase
MRATEQLAPRIVINAASYGVNPGEQDADLMTAVNVTAVHTLLKASRACGAQRFIQLGSYSEYGDHPGPLSEDAPLRPKNAYAATKAAASLLAAEASLSHPVETTVLRLFNIWGPFESAHRLVPQVIESCRSKTSLSLTAGTQKKDYTFAPDLARWIVDVAVHAEPYRDRIVNFASGRMMAVRDLVLAVAGAFGGEGLMNFGAKAVPAGEVQTGAVDTKRIDALLPSRRITPLDEAVTQTTAAERAC